MKRAPDGADRTNSRGQSIFDTPFAFPVKGLGVRQDFLAVSWHGFQPWNSTRARCPCHGSARLPENLATHRGWRRAGKRRSRRSGLGACKRITGEFVVVQASRLHRIAGGTPAPQSHTSTHCFFTALSGTAMTAPRSYLTFNELFALVDARYERSRMRRMPSRCRQKVDSILELIGNTPLVRINRMNPAPGVELLAKLETRTRRVGEGPHRSADDRAGRGQRRPDP